ncbi:hypothetical protein ACLB2K_005927 [Fragaria x ananassa]
MRTKYVREVQFIKVPLRQIIPAALLCGWRDEIADILVHGFGNVNADECGRIQLFPAKYALDGASASQVGDDGFKHMLLSRVILGKMEEGPASLEGYVTSTSTTTQTGSITQGNARYKRSALGHVILAALLAALTRFLTPREMKIVVRFLQDFRAKKFDADELKRQARLNCTLGGLQLENGSVRDIYLPGLITVLAEFLPAKKIEMLSKSLFDFKVKKINRPQLATSPSKADNVRDNVCL